MSLIDTLAPLRAHGKVRTTGLDDAIILDFAARDPQLGEAIAAAAAEYARIRDEFRSCWRWTRTRRPRRCRPISSTSTPPTPPTPTWR